jgi:hypothetical protein
VSGAGRPAADQQRRLREKSSACPMQLSRRVARRRRTEPKCRVSRIEQLADARQCVSPARRGLTANSQIQCLGLMRRSAFGRAVEMMPRSDLSDRARPESSRRGQLEPVALGDASSERAPAARRASIVLRDEAPPEAVHDLLTDAQLAACWQLSRGTLAISDHRAAVLLTSSWPAEFDAAARISKPMSRPDSCRGSQPERRPGGSQLCGEMCAEPPRPGHASRAARTAPALLLWSQARSGSRWAGAAKT